MQPHGPGRLVEVAPGMHHRRAAGCRGQAVMIAWQTWRPCPTRSGVDWRAGRGDPPVDRPRGEKGDLLREEIDALLPADVASREVDDLLSRCRDAGIDVDAAALEREGPHHARPDADESDLTPGRPNTSSDVVRLYLADMSRVPLLTRQEEVTLAKRSNAATGRSWWRSRRPRALCSRSFAWARRCGTTRTSFGGSSRIPMRRSPPRGLRHERATSSSDRRGHGGVDRGAGASGGLAQGTHTASAHRPTSPVERAARAGACGPADPPHRVQ